LSTNLVQVCLPNLQSGVSHQVVFSASPLQHVSSHIPLVSLGQL
jgi:hypothetical protein